MTEKFLTTDELAEALKVPKSWVYSRTRERGEDTIPKLAVGKYYRFHLNEVLEWLKKREERN